MVAAVLLLSGCAHTSDFDATGNFEATEITISAETSGRILSLRAQEGNQVHAGEELGAIDSLQLHLQRLQLQKQVSSIRSSKPDIERQVAALRSQIEQLQREKNRTEALLKDGATTSKSLDDINAQLEVLNAQLTASLSSLRSNSAVLDENSSAVELQIAQTEDLLRKCRITSPINGTILSQYMHEGEFAVAGKPLFNVAALDTLQMRAYFTSVQLSDIRIGQRVRVYADFGADNQIEYPGVIRWIAQESEFTPKTIQTKDSRANLVYAVKIAVPNDGRLKIGLSGFIRL